MSDTSADKRERPLSPHLQVYKPQLTSTLSILHRMSGVALAIGTIMVVWWLVAAASGPDAYNTAKNFASSPAGLIMLFGWSAALYYHMCNGMRHLLWDMGYLFKIENAYRGGYVVLLAATLLTAATWYCAYFKADGVAPPAGIEALAQAATIEGDAP